MKRLLIVLGILVTCGLLIYFFPPFHAQAKKILAYSACDKPLAYNIGSIDSRFGMSGEEAMRDTVEATEIWNNAASRKLFIYKEKAALTVNFVYDERQELNKQINALNSNLKESSQTLKNQVAAFEADKNDFERRLKEFNETVDNYNRNGGAPESIYNDLNKKQKELQAEGDALNIRARQLNFSTTDYNGNVSALNQDITKLNDVLAEKPEEGIYNSADNTITIYFAGNQKELIHTLSHEFGHALGMDHLNSREAIMYPYTTDFVTVTSADFKQLSYVCREQSAIVHTYEVFDYWVRTQVQNMKQKFHD